MTSLYSSPLPKSSSPCQSIYGHHWEHDSYLVVACIFVLCQHIPFQMQVPIVKCLEELYICSKCPALLALIPNTIKVEHYVYLRLLLRK